ncbi:16S rRNA (uracil(1498)-N(3))-methyltransferase [Nitrospina gracilis]|uniref:16S rRNA (uracil(1498)-N(3))-methyltransferase n=1 Tax=Nitrospina gracilis TaxID=35801 RepID=UPI001F022D9A|nr:16S rRNA (uracil(1498)-N(3))-methyltransferase [Nitrospina gracilis]MCF8720806.1 16S rRNA (uracil1498-N3)-methyltransferase [Nitrospina gracilis Nb-211]
MHRFFVPPEQIDEKRVTVRGSDVNHIRNVLRLKVGDRICVLDGFGKQWQVRLTRLDAKEVEGEVVTEVGMDTESPVKIIMGQALIKGNRFDHLVRKAVELGVHRIVPLETQRCVAKVKKHEAGKKLERWQRIAEEAAKQCGRSQIPQVGPDIHGLKAFCDQVGASDLKLLFWEDEARTRLRDIEPPGNKVETLAFVAGPEGGWDPQEVEFLKESGFQTVGLGPRTLRADAVSLVILSLLQHRWGDL